MHADGNPELRIVLRPTAPVTFTAETDGRLGIDGAHYTVASSIALEAGDARTWYLLPGSYRWAWKALGRHFRETLTGEFTVGVDAQEVALP